MLCGLLWIAPADAATEPPPKAGPTTSAAAEPAAAEATMELIKLLGIWQTDDGQWVDPEQLEQMHLPQERNNHGD